MGWEFFKGRPSLTMRQIGSQQSRVPAANHVTADSPSVTNANCEINYMYKLVLGSSIQQFSVAVTRWSRSMQLFYNEPG